MFPAAVVKAFGGHCTRRKKVMFAASYALQFSLCTAVCTYRVLLSNLTSDSERTCDTVPDPAAAPSKSLGMRTPSLEGPIDARKDGATEWRSKEASCFRDLERRQPRSDS